jgi:type I restriction enzyme M protein
MEAEPPKQHFQAFPGNKDAIFLIANPALLVSVIEQIDKMLDLLDKQAKASQDQSYVDLMGDLYEYMLSKLTQAGQNNAARH